MYAFNLGTPFADNPQYQEALLLMKLVYIVGTVYFLKENSFINWSVSMFCYHKILNFNLQNVLFDELKTIHY